MSLAVITNCTEAQQPTSSHTVALTVSDIKPGDVLCSSSARYFVDKFIGGGAFGKVMKCQNVETGETVAVKIFKKRCNAEYEIKLRETLSVLNLDQTSIVKFYDWFEHQGLICLVFENLFMDLFKATKLFNLMPLTHIRYIAKQLLETLDQLKNIGVIHNDIKPDNVAITDENFTLVRVKFLDFGNALLATDVKHSKVPILPYRPPEVLLGLPINKAIDIWGCGCLLAFLYIGRNLFPVNSEYHVMKHIVEVLGQPEDHLLDAGRFTNNYFIKEEAAAGFKWRLKTPEEFTAESNWTLDLPRGYSTRVTILDDLRILRWPETSEEVEFEDRCQFVDLLKKMLHVDGRERISAHEALQHPFITMAHMNEHADSIYLAMSKKNMGFIQKTDEENTSSASALTSVQECSCKCKEVPVTSLNYEAPITCSSNQEVPPVIEAKDPAETLNGRSTKLKRFSRFLLLIRALFSQRCPRVKDR